MAVFKKTLYNIHLIKHLQMSRSKTKQKTLFRNSENSRAKTPNAPLCNSLGACRSAIFTKI